MLLVHWNTPRCLASSADGRPVAAIKTAVIAITTSSSIRVNPAVVRRERISSHVLIL